MGQKVNPIGLRIGYTRDWRSRWFAARGTEFAAKLIEDLELRTQIKERFKQFAVSRINIERFGDRVRITILTARPGLIIGNKGAEIEKLKTELSKQTGKEVFVDVVEVKNPETDAQLVAESVAQQLERRISFRRAMKKVMQTALDLGADGIKVKLSGRLGGADLARTEQYSEGKVPLQTISANLDYGFTEAETTTGKIGCKVWICKPLNLESHHGNNAKKGKVQKGTKRKSRG